MPRFSRTMLAFGLTAIVLGCEPGDKSVEVSGLITFNGEPVGDGSIQFAGDGADATTAIVSKGRYLAKVKLGKKKVVIEGFKKVGVDYRDPNDKSTAFDKLESFLPYEFNRATKLTADITGSNSSLDFPLTGKEQAPGKDTSGGRR